MDTAAPKTTPPAQGPKGPQGLGADDLHVVLFGRPAAGKTSLLGALAEAAATQPDTLGGTIADESGGLAALRRQVYDTAGKRTPEEVVPYPVRYEPAGGRPADAVLVDCDGRVAGDILVAGKPADDAPEGTLAREVADADALLLVTDASADGPTLEADFTAFARFLGMIEERRGDRTEVGGLPVFLVLTKCDLLGRPTDTNLDWMDRIEQRKRDVGDRFREFLASSADAGFGRIDLNVWATAVKKPALVGVVAKDREPLGVAELFRQALAAASAFRGRADRSESRLNWLVGAAAALLLSFVGLTALFLAWSPGTPAGTLQTRAEEMLFSDKETPAERLQGGVERLRRRLKDLQAIRDDEGFKKLPADLQARIDSRREELRDYLVFYDRILHERSPASERSEEGLERQVERLKGELSVPPAFAGTPAAKRHAEHLQTAEAIKEGVQVVRNHYLDSSDAASKVLAFNGFRSEAGIDWPGWSGAAERLIDPARKAPFVANDALPNTAGLTYETAMQFDRAAQARATWEADRADVRAVLDACTALGLAPASAGRPAALVFSPTFALKEAKERLEQLKTAYPAYEKAFTRKALPEAVRPIVARAARSQYANLLNSGRGEVLRQLKLAGTGREETTKRWEAVRAWLRSPEELAAWRPLALTLLRMEQNSPDDPAAALASFLAKGQFTIEFRTAVLEVPIVSGLAPREGAKLAVYHPASKRTPALSFSQSGDPQKGPDGRTMRYTFRLADGRSIVYRPGDDLHAELPLKGGKQILAWVDSRSALYQLERLANTPRVGTEGAASHAGGRLADGVTLDLRGDDPLPAVPDLLPPVRLDD